MTHLPRPVREIAATSVMGGKDGTTPMAVFLGGGQASVYSFDNTTGAGSWDYRNATAGRSPWGKMGRATAGVGQRFAVFAGGNGNCHNIEVIRSFSLNLPSRPCTLT